MSEAPLRVQGERMGLYGVIVFEFVNGCVVTAALALLARGGELVGWRRSAGGSLSNGGATAYRFLTER